MNIFEVLSQGKGAVNEENVSAFIAYLLNPNETHGLKDVFLKKFLEAINYDIKNYDTLQVKNIRLEVPFRDTQGSKERVIDILLELYNPFVGEHIIAVENKIMKDSVRKGQLRDECEFISDTKVSFDFVFLTPQMHNPNILPEIKELESLYKNSFHTIYWCDTKNSIITLLSDILMLESVGTIPPIADYIKHTIKSFIYYISHKNINQLKNCISFQLYYNGMISEFILKQYSDFRADLYIKQEQTFKLLKNKTSTLLSGFVEYYYNRKPATTNHAADLFIKALNSANGEQMMHDWNQQQLKHLV